MKYELVLFDLDGTLTDPQKGMKNSILYALGELGVSTEITNFNAFIGPPLRDTLREAFGFHGEQNELAVTKYREYFGTKGLLENELYMGIIPMLEELSKSGAKITMATSKVTEYAKIIAEHFAFAKYFDFIGGSEFDGTRSAKAEVIEHVLSQYSVPKNRVVMIGDRKHDIVGAKTHGIDSIGVLWGFGGEAELTEAGATFLANAPQDVLYLIGADNGNS